jgi:hypothetical protein
LSSHFSPRSTKSRSMLPAFFARSPPCALHKLKLVESPHFVSSAAVLHCVKDRRLAGLANLNAGPRHRRAIRRAHRHRRAEQISRRPWRLVPVRSNRNQGAARGESHRRRSRVVGRIPVFSACRELELDWELNGRT